MNKAKPPLPSLESLLFEALDMTPDGFCMFGPDDRVVFSNHNYAQLFSDTPKQFVGKTFRQASLQTYQSAHGLHIDTDDIDSWIDYALSKRRQQPFRSFQTDTKDGKWLQLTEQLLEDGHMLVYFTDVTAQKAAEAKLLQLTEQLRHHAQTDSLTGTHNRRHFTELSTTELERCYREKRDCAMLAIDVDHFKQINDQLGHPGGDHILSSLVQALNNVMRPYDILGRIGGEEFAVLLPGAHQALAEKIAERLRRTIEQCSFEFQQQPIRVTISVGITIAQAPQDLDQLFAKADQALYLAKRSGRNQVRNATNLPVGEA
ncbi:MAG: diguanylate cyclase [Halopseudomonas sp.]